MYLGNSPANVGNYQVVDDISSTFNGVLTSFALTASSLPINPAKSGQLLVSINGVLQEPDDTGTEGFKVSGSNIVFSSAPATGSTFWAVFQGQNVDIGTPSDGTVGTAQMSSAELALTGGLSLGDNVKAKFGASDDLQIYHNSSNTHSYITESGGGNLYINGTDVYLRDTGNVNFFKGISGGEVALYYGTGLKKLATTSNGIDVTGSVTCDGLDVNSATMRLATGNHGYALMHYGQHSTASNNWHIGSEGDGTFRFYNGNPGAGSERMRITSAGNVGIGTSSPTVNNKGLHINNSGANTIEVHLTNSTTGTTTGDGLSIQVDGSGDAYISQREAKDIITYTNGYERMRIDSSGLVAINTTSRVYSSEMFAVHGGSSQAIGAVTDSASLPVLGLWCKDSSGNGKAINFASGPGGAGVGSISVTSSATSYNTSSDYRLKENVVPMTGSIDRLKELKPSRFNFIADADTTVDGFLAHEAGEVVPECATGTKDAMMDEEYEVTPAVEATYDDDGNELTPPVEAVMGEREVEDYQGIDQSKLVPLLVASLQEAVAKIEALEARVTALEPTI